MVAVDVSPWLRLDANTSPRRSFCHTYGRGKGEPHMIPGWPYSVVAALETGRTSWTAVLDAIRLPPVVDLVAVTTAQLRDVVHRLITAGPPITGRTAAGQPLGGDDPATTLSTARKSSSA